MSNEDPFKIKTPEFRGSYVTLAKARAVNDGEPEFAITVVLDKDHKFWRRLRKLQDKAAEKKWGKVPKKLKRGVKDGDDEDQPEEWEGCNAVIAKVKEEQGRPKVIDTSGDLIIDLREEVYSGAWYKITARVGAWSHPTGGKGVGLYLINVLKVRDDEPFGTKQSSPAEDFADDLEDVGDDDDDPMG